MESLNVYWNKISERVCRKCIDGDRRGNCRLPAGESCALQKFLPEIIVAVSNGQHPTIESVVHTLRRNVCILCEWQDAKGECRKRDTLECALDRYLPLVCEVVEDVRRTLDPQGVQQPSA
ncbi:MAG TPA: hypothetical protein VMM57_10830 [Bacteroidota bacterium]|nr:hypothetical protein [Bacteroidota bacterium]